MLDNDIKEVLVSKEQLEEINARLGAQITRDFADKNLLVIGILKGSIYFMTDLTRCNDLPLKLDFMAVSSYGGGTTSTGAVQIRYAEERHVGVIAELGWVQRGWTEDFEESPLQYSRTLTFINHIFNNAHLL